MLVDGHYTTESIFQVNEMGHPPSEGRSAARKIFGHHDFLGLGAMSLSEEVRECTCLPRADSADMTLAQADLVQAERSPQHETSFIILSDLHLDNHKIMMALEEVLSVYENMEDADKPALFVLCGNFRSSPFLYDGEATREYQGDKISEHSDILRIL